MQPQSMIRAALAMVLAAAALGSPATAALPSAVTVARTGAQTVEVRWTATGPVDVLVADRADAPVAKARLVSANDRDGAEAIIVPYARPYVLLRDPASGKVVRAAERLVPLATGSNFRDIGGYEVAGGRHVRWGLIYRSGATPLLDAADLQRVRALELASMIDLRSDEERVLAPSRIDGVPYTAVGYSMAGLRFDGGMEAGYRQMPTSLAPHLRQIFAQLLRQQTPLAYNCSAGQDRTGFATAMILAALGAPRETILADYHLSTALRQPANEMPPIDAAQAAANPVARMFAAYQQQGKLAPQPLKTADGRAFLSFALDEIDSRWGSVEAYLAAEVGVGPAELRSLRAHYTE